MKDLFDHSYLTVLGQEQGKNFHNVPNMRKQNFKYFTPNAADVKDDDRINQSKIHHITFFNCPTFIATMYDNRYTSYEYVAYGVGPDNISVLHWNSDPNTVQIFPSIRTHHFRCYVYSEEQLDKNNPQDLEKIRSLFVGKTFTRYIWPREYTFYANNENLRGLSNTEVNFNINKDNIDYVSLYKATTLLYQFEPTIFGYNDVKDTLIDKWEQYRWINTYTSYADDKNGTSAQWEENIYLLYWRKIEPFFDDTASVNLTDERLLETFDYVRYINELDREVYKLYEDSNEILLEAPGQPPYYRGTSSWLEYVSGGFISGGVEWEYVPVQYTVTYKFSAFDVLTKEELVLDEVMINDEVVPVSNDAITEENGRYMYEMIYEFDSKVKELNIKLIKETYFTFDTTIKTDEIRVDETTGSMVIDLGRIGMLNEVKEDAFVLTWNANPRDLDSRLKCPNGEVVGITQTPNGAQSDGVLRSNEYAEVSVDSNVGFGPETLTIKRWLDTSPSSQFKIGGHYDFYVNWFKD